MKVINQRQTFVDRLGIPSNLFWGYIGIIIFMIGDGLEQGWLSPYLIDQGLSMEKSALLFTVYGITVTAASWFSGVFVQTWGPRKAMIYGLIFFLLGTAAFISIGVSQLNYPAMLVGYALRGFGYPLFAYSFLVWVSYRTPQQKLGMAVGWFWVVFTCGLSVLGPFYSSFAIPKIGEINTLWSGAVFVVLGGVFALLFNRDQFKGQKTGDNKAKKLLKGIIIMFENPKVAIGGVVKTINAIGQYGFMIFLPTYLKGYGFSVSEWLQIYGTMFSVTVIFNLVFGIVGDKLGWRNTVMWFGGVGCAISTLAIYYVPQFVGHNYWMVMLAAYCYGAALAAYVPLTALLPSLAPENKGAAMAVLNLGSGLCTFIAPAIVGVFIGPLGVGGIMWIFAVLYFISAFLTQFLTLPKLIDEIPLAKAE